MKTLLGWLAALGGVGGVIVAAAFVPPPFKKYALAAAIGITIASSTYLKIRHDAQADIIQEIEKEKTDAIDSARAARDNIRDLCQRDPAGCVPDDWFRD